MKSKLVWLAIGGMLLAGCGSAATSPTMTTAPQNNYQVMGGTPTPAPAPVQQPVQQPMPMPAAPCIDCGSYAPWAAVERDYGFNTGYGIPFGYRDVIYDASPWARGFGIYGVPCVGCPVTGPVVGHPGGGHGPGHGRPMPPGHGGGDNGDDNGNDNGGETTTNY
jgi:hypothetical protein